MKRSSKGKTSTLVLPADKNQLCTVSADKNLSWTLTSEKLSFHDKLFSSPEFLTITRTFAALGNDIHTTAKSKGWWSGQGNKDSRDYLKVCALFHSELSEALEEYRNNTPSLYYNSRGRKKVGLPHKLNIKPEGLVVELADLVIRLFDYLKGTNQLDDFTQAMYFKIQYNKTRSFRHGGKKC